MPKAKLTGSRFSASRDSADLSMLSPYVSHGLDISKTMNGQAICQCPFCDKDKFHISLATGKADCKVCGWSGNAKSFLDKLWDVSFDATTKEEYEELRQDRRYKTTEALIHWGCCKSVITNEWLVPGYNNDGTLRQLYRYVKQWDVKKKIWFHSLWLTKGLYAQDSHGLHGVPLMNSADTVYICEGIWDGIALWEALKLCNRSEEASVLAIPGCNIWQDKWAILVQNKRVILLFDSDHPRSLPNGVEAGREGYKAMERLTRKMSGGDRKPKEILYINWGPDGYDPDRKTGYDVRDFLCQR